MLEDRKIEVFNSNYPLSLKQIYALKYNNIDNIDQINGAVSNTNRATKLKQ